MKLTIEESDLRCTILEGVRELLGGLDPNVWIAEDRAKRIADAVVACGDQQLAIDAIPTSINTSLTVLDRLVSTLLTTPMRAPARAGLLVEASVQIDLIRRNVNTVVHAIGSATVPAVHTDCYRVAGGTAPCVCVDGCGACDSCGLWIGDAEHQPRVDRATRRLLGCSCGFSCSNETQLSVHMTVATSVKPEPVCSHCNDSHSMDLDGRVVMCTRCPVPCEKCRQQRGGNAGPGAFCETTPCSCKCHEPKIEPMPSWTKPE